MKYINFAKGVVNYKKIIAELKNKHNTMKGDARINIYDDLEKCLKTTNKGFTGYYVEILPKNAKNIIRLLNHQIKKLN